MHDELETIERPQPCWPWSGRTLPPVVTDERGRQVLAHAKPAVRVAIDGRRVIERFLIWMRHEQGAHRDEPISADDVREYFAWFADVEAVELLRDDDLLEGVAAARGVQRRRERLRGDAFATIRRSLRARGRDAERTTVYRISSFEEMAANANQRRRGRPQMVVSADGAMQAA